MDISRFLNSVNAVIINPIIVLVFAIAFLVFFWGLYQFISKAGESKDREEGKKKILYGLFGMFIMFSDYGLMRLVLNTFGITSPQYLNSAPNGQM